MSSKPTYADLEQRIKTLEDKCSHASTPMTGTESIRRTENH